MPCEADVPAVLGRRDAGRRLRVVHFALGFGEGEREKGQEMSRGILEGVCEARGIVLVRDVVRTETWEEFVQLGASLSGCCSTKVR